MDEQKENKFITEAEILEVLRDRLNRYKDSKATQAGIARAIGIHRPYVSMVAHGKKPMSDKIAAFLGYERVVLYRPIKQDDND